MLLTPVDAILLPERCYRCITVTRPLAGLLVAGRCFEKVFLEFEDVAPVVARSVSPAELRRLRIGQIKVRRSGPRGSYLANGCHVCDAILGSHYIMESLDDYLSEGGAITDLIATRWHVDLGRMADVVRRSAPS